MPPQLDAETYGFSMSMRGGGLAIRVISYD
jgi:hypothetical protein